MLNLLSVPDEKSWKAEAEIDMELFHQVKWDCLFAIFDPNDYCKSLMSRVDTAAISDLKWDLDVIILSSCWFKGL